MNLGFVYSKITNEGRVGIIPLVAPQKATTYLKFLENPALEPKKFSTVNEIYAVLPQGLEYVDVGDIVVYTNVKQTYIVLAKLQKYDKYKLPVDDLLELINEITKAPKLKLTTNIDTVDNFISSCLKDTNSIAFYYTKQPKKNKSTITLTKLDFFALKYKNKLYVVMLDEENRYVYFAFSFSYPVYSTILKTGGTSVEIRISYEGSRVDVAIGDNCISFDGTNNIIQILQNNSLVAHIQNNKLVINADVEIAGNVKISGVLEANEVKTNNVQTNSLQTNDAKVMFLNSQPTSFIFGPAAIFMLTPAGLTPMIAVPFIITPPNTTILPPQNLPPLQKENWDI